eukprot:gene35670-9825_t
MAEKVDMGHDIGESLTLLKITPPPPRIILETPKVWPELAGKFRLQRGQQRGMRYWKKEEGVGWLACNWDRSNWMFSIEKDHFDQGLGWIAGTKPHRGRMPHLIHGSTPPSSVWEGVDGWGFTTSPDEAWKPEASIKVIAGELAEGESEYPEEEAKEEKKEEKPEKEAKEEKKEAGQAAVVSSRHCSHRLFALRAAAAAARGRRHSAAPRSD